MISSYLNTRKFLFWSVLATSVSFSIAAAPATSLSYELNEELLKCRSDAECTIVTGNCGLEWPANQKYAAQIQMPDVACHKPIEEHPKNTVAQCKNNECVLYPPGIYAGGSPITHCHSDNECTVMAYGDCGGEWAVNKGFRMPPPLKYHIPCNMIERHADGTTAKCEHSTCVLSPPTQYIWQGKVP